MGQAYQITDHKDSEKLARFLAKEGQLLLPMVDLIEQAHLAVDELIDVVGTATVEAVLELSAQQVAGGKRPGKAGGPIGWHGRQRGRVCLSERKLRVRKPRLRRKGSGRGGEVEIPAYEAMQEDARLGQRMLDILMRGVSTRQYEAVLPAMAETVGVSKSSVSREFVEASADQIEALCERRFDDVDLLVIYLDGLRFGEHHVIGAVGVDAEGHKHVLGLVQGASENAQACSDLLTDLVSRGVTPDRRRLFVIDGSKALRAAIDRVFGSRHPVQRCRNHKITNVVDYLPKDMRPQVRRTMKAAYRLEADEGMAKLKKLAEWLRVEYPSAAESLLEGLQEMFTVNRLDLSSALSRCLCTTNLIENPHAGVRLRTRRVGRWRDGQMVLRWAASAFLATEKQFRRIMGYRDLWMLKAYLDDDSVDEKKGVA
jgi:putative transposase